VVTNVDLEFWARDAAKAVIRGYLVIVIDALRSGTSIVNALVNGAKEVIPVLSLKEAYALQRKNPKYLLAGERGGRKPKRFDFGNSPLEFVSEKVKGKTLVMTTTSGTAALTRCRRAERVLIGSFLNAKAAAEKAESIATKEGIGISFILAGEKGKFSMEDLLCAGAIADGFVEGNFSFSDKVQTALLAFKQAESNLMGNVMKAAHAKHLVTLGLGGDISFCCKLDVLKAVPIYKGGRISLQD
jgi:2-phosphosulfolactate phosphatase